MKYLVLILILIVTSCQTTKYPFYFKELGRLDCEMARSLQLGIEYSKANPDDSIGIDSLMKVYDFHVNNYQSFTDKYWELEAKIKGQFTEEKGNADYLEGYAPCNCDTCLFSKESLEEPVKKKKTILKQI